MMLYAAAAEGVHVGRMRSMLLEKMVAPVGAPPAVQPAAALTEVVMAMAAGASNGSGSGSSSGAAAAAGAKR